MAACQQMLPSAAAALCAPPHSAAHARAALAGFRHAAFTFGAESLVAKSNINGAKIPPGQLISFVQKGIMYQELERSVADDGSVAGSSEPFSLLRASDGTAGKASPSEGPPAKKHKSENDSSRGAGSSRGGVRILLSRGSKPARLHLQRGSKPARLHLQRGPMRCRLYGLFETT